MAIDWLDVLFGSSGPGHIGYAVVTLAIFLFLLLADRKNWDWSVGIAGGGMVSHALQAYIAWELVMVQGVETGTYSVHCIWFNGLLALTYALLIVTKGLRLVRT